MVIYLVIAAILFILEVAYFHVADHFNIIDKPNERSSHTQVVLRGGGIIFLLGMWVWAVFYGLQYPWFLLGLTSIAGISFIDDIHSLPDSVRLVIQFTAMGLMLYELGLMTADMWWWIPLVLIVCVGIINAFNFMDGINGITGGYSLAVLLPLLYLDTVGLEFTGLEQAFIDPSLLWVTTLSVVVFCFFNFRTKARCFAGDVGSVGIAFIILFALLQLMIKTEDISYILLLVVYGVDSVLTICHRIMLHEHLGEAHRKHAYQLMANELKIPHTLISTFYMVLQLAVSFGLLLTVQRWLYCGSVIIALGLAYLNFMREYYGLHEKYLASLKNI